LLGGGMLDSLTAVMSCLGGVGPSIGVWGPMESYSSASTVMKWIFSFLMLVGRLEIYTVLVLFRPLRGKRHKNKHAMSLETLEENALLEPMVREK
ncbi:MAG: potassium transporter TrkG, partial [Peptococcaceae bacterium]